MRATIELLSFCSRSSCWAALPVVVATCSASTRAGRTCSAACSARSSASSTALLRIDPEREQTWRAVRARSARVLRRRRRASSTPSSACRATCRSTRRLKGVRPDIAFNTAWSFVTNTNWQNYGGESTMSATSRRWPAWRCRTSPRPPSASPSPSRWSAASPARTRDGIGNFWADLVRGCSTSCSRSRSSSPSCSSSRGVVQTFDGPVARARRSRAPTQTIARGPAASQIAIKQLGTNGGGFFNANSAHPFESAHAVHEHRSRSVVAAADPVLAAVPVRPDARPPAPGRRAVRGDGDPVRLGATRSRWPPRRARRPR